MGLKCEYRVDPLGIDARVPRLSWALESEGRGQVQSAYRILAARSEEDLEAEESLQWDSGRVESGRTVGVEYGGEALVSGSHCVWKVCVWDGAGNPSPYSGPAVFEIGLAGEVGLEGNLDLRRQRSCWRYGAPLGGRVRRPGQRSRPEPLPAQGIFTGQTGPQGAPLRDSPRRLRTIREREQGRGRRARPRLDGLRQARPVPDLRRHAATRGGPERHRRRPRRRLVRGVRRVRSQAQGRPLRPPSAASRAAQRRVRGRQTKRASRPMARGGARRARSSSPTSSWASHTTPAGRCQAGPGPASTTRMVRGGSQRR